MTRAPLTSAADGARRRPSWSKGRWFGVGVALIGVAALVGGAWWLINGGAGEARGPMGGRRAAATVGVAVARRADIPITLEALGAVTPAATVTVRPQVAGVLTRIAFREGQMVRKGEVLVEIDPRPFQLALGQAQGNLARDQAQLENAKLTLGRYRTLLAQDSIARQDVDTQAATARQFEGVVATDRAAVGQAKLNLEYARITAPVAGRVGLRQVDLGNYVAVGDTTGVAVITEVAPIDVQFAVPEDEVPRIQARVAKSPAPSVTALDRTRSTTLGEGVFLTLDNLVDPTTGTVKAKARFANPKGALFPSQFVNVRLLLDTLRGAIVVPASAVRHGPQGDFVFVVKADSTASLRKIVTGPADADLVSVTSGLAEGEKVVTEGGDRVVDGGRVQLPGAHKRPPGGANGKWRGRKRRQGGAAGGGGGDGGGPPG